MVRGPIRPWRRVPPVTAGSVRMPRRMSFLPRICVALVAFPGNLGDVRPEQPHRADATAMKPCTDRQRRTVRDLIADTAIPETAEEAGRLIRDLKRETESLPALIEQIVEADEAGDADRLGMLLRRARHRARYGDWLPLLTRLGIHPRRAQRLMARTVNRGEF